ncbi:MULTISPECIES: hypothetical protein [Corynebacterium]|uniref:hypothetical protein n=1 Tax=Corynebacterium TaxID=1716 RepID=UPI0008A45512|nr:MULTISPECIES: hypothetical protein [Corynebacterium]MCX2163182.1 hypothetical protein [Corynebacterium auriscanis]OFT88411.1 hypothetical protein HMPREF3098_08295 [Corynebacterium sp. HMSC28B08]
MLNNQNNGDIVSQRKAEVRQRTRSIQIAGGVVVASTLAGVFLVKTPLLTFVIPLLGLLFVLYNMYKVREIVNHKDQW